MNRRVLAITMLFAPKAALACKMPVDRRSPKEKIDAAYVAMADGNFSHANFIVRSIKVDAKATAAEKAESRVIMAAYQVRDLQNVEATTKQELEEALKADADATRAAISAVRKHDRDVAKKLEAILDSLATKGAEG